MSDTENPFESQPRIFVVDDQREIAKMLMVVLQMNLFNAIAYTDPRDALEAAIAFPTDYIISDIVMPGMNGIELAIRVRSELPTCKVLLFPGHADESQLIDKAKTSEDHFNLVEKQIHPTKLVEAIQNL
jgi:DNA-binding NtrC family response regulator